MTIKKIGVTLIVLLLGSHIIFAQQKRSLTHSDYDGWESLGSQKITKNGQWVGYQVRPQDGDSRLEIFSFKDPSKRKVIPRGESYIFTEDNLFAVGKIGPEKDSVYMLKLKKTKKDDMPADSLFIYNLAGGKLEKLPRVKSFATPEKAGNWIAIHFEKEKQEKAKTDKKAEADSTSKVEKPKKTDGTLLQVRKLDGSVIYDFERVKSFGFSKNGDFLQYVLAEEDTLDNASIYLLNLANGESKMISEGMTSYSDLTFSPESNYLAYLTTDDSTKAKKPYYSLFIAETKTAKVKELASKDSEGILKNGRISADGNLKFSENEQRLFFGVVPDYVDYSYANDTTILDEERVSLDIWGWQDSEIQPMQLKNKGREEKFSYLATIDLASNKIIQLADLDVKNVSLESKVERDFGIAWSDAPYRINYSWDIQTGRDLYLVDFKTGQKTLIEKDASGSPSISPEGTYVYWYDSRDSSWVAYDVGQKAKINLTEGISEVFYEELHDSPSRPGSYGNAGWLAEDKAFLVYDRFDIWKIDPKNPSGAVNLTQGEGRKSELVFRRQDLDREERSIDPKGQLLLTVFNEKTKDAGYYTGSFDGKSAPKQLVMSANRYYGLTKAEESTEVILNKSTYAENPDLYLGDLTFKNLKKVSALNPQQANVNWGSVELVDYLTNDGEPLQGLLFKPENFDAKKKYPLMVYFYERNSDGLHNYRAPAPSASTINIPYFVSNDYLVFVPDIKYELGLPGPSAYNCIIPGVQSIVAKGFVDADNMAIQGQSWGGYQVAHLITRTNMFKAAGAGAPVVNMTSAYGGIRWGTGMSRMFQYEQTQSRIGGTLWEKPLYYIENSPLFFMDRVNTPVLIMHNDEDGSVPWYQGIEMFMALKRLNQPAWLLQYNGEDHNLVQRKNRKDLSVRLSQFFDHYLKGAPAPLWMTEGLPAVEKGKTLKYELNP
ncbi:dipeptidyl aminopeptidase/acylaminoacyl peptidase [Algoriphagus ratkowskyi]|uniref:Dipeptidyl aminopeptidase/acylaminoacyl peptidase n=1 Tax=Algoriphagus ratkowskyi TaxID=57028 RepID=A0A2W7RF53_9BACT|nr:prolyl oligopeptidase family serine peptidase [Algoriphagus ratkowskyi]PZX57756.1 dipeptidyl aminopeptidase/acylaminoacyl peptidase [Algoriphagus ratkowskyi]TXD79022.1 S9 family peptidase [Algoriphagus ratkowskyi]